MMVDCEDFIREIREEFPEFRIIEKAESPLSKAIDIALKVITLGGQRTFLTEYYTVIGDTLYVPPGWDDTPHDERVIVLRHERVHMRQRRRYGLPLMTFLYFIPFFPVGLAYGRARIEWEAYAETLRATAELRGKDAIRDPALRQKIVERFTGSAYGWMWPFGRSVERWYDAVVAEIEGERALWQHR